MVKYKHLILVGIVSLGLLVVFFQTQLSSSEFSYSSEETTPLTSETNYDLIESVMNAKLSQFTSQGYFDQCYEPSLQATYYALASLDKLGKLTEVSFSELATFIMSYYNTTTKAFMDDYTKRYLDTNYSIFDYPLNSLLLTNCYATLSLSLIGYLNLIDTTAMKNFIWNCYNLETSGFIGRPYSIGLPSEWRVSTMDNTYYAVITYDLLSNKDWSTKIAQKNAIIDFVESLQDFLRGGGFHNDLDPSWYSLDLAEPNIYASYYCIMTLEVFTWIPAINLPEFHAYLKSLYNTQDYYFESVKNPFFPNKTNVVSSALGLALCHLTGNETFINKNAIVNFVTSHRNPEGGFYRSSTDNSYELLDLYQILCGLNDAGEATQLSIEDKQKLATFLTLYIQKEGGFAPISKNYMSASLLYSVIESFFLYEQEYELPIQALYSLITANFREVMTIYGFSACNPASTFRIQPVDYLYVGTQQNLPVLRLAEGHYATYLSLMALTNLRKLNDFASSHDLQLFIDTVIQSQFLDINFPQTFGAFNYFYTSFSPSIRNELISLKYSYYAIKVMELISQELSIGPLISLGFDVDALDTYLLRHVMTSSTEQYVSNGMILTPEDVLEQTYFAAYILKAINRNTLDLPKIKTFIESTINYSNIKNIYYCFKLSECLDLNLDFEVKSVHILIQAIYSADTNEFYLTPEKIDICQDALYYIAEMAKTDQIRIIALYPSSLPLGDTMMITVDLANLVLRDFGPYTTVRLESDQIGTYIMDLQTDLSFTKSLQIQAIAGNFPSISGDIVVYEGSSKITSQSFEIPTSYDTITTVSTSQTLTKISLTLNASVSFISETQAILNGKAYIEVYKNHLFIDIKQFNQQGFLRYTTFSLDYYPSIEGTYRIEVYLMDGINKTAQKISELNYTCTDPDITSGYRTEATEAIPIFFVLLLTPGIAIVVSYKDRFLNHNMPTKSKHRLNLSKILKRFTSK